ISTDRGTLLLVGASRGLGHALAAEFVKKGWHVIGTVRETDRTDLHDLAEAHPGQVAIEALDVTEPSQIAALHDRLADRAIDLL
ncbi:SDR family NAD(P)-dependent oxidoreductase, partial [Escherichia coli]